MLTVRKSNERGSADLGWLKTSHSFSFADYHDPKHMGFGPLRVINEDVIAGGMGFSSHPHKDMEIISYVTKGALEHKDSMGNTGVIKPGEVQYMSAGSGVVHSEFNHFKDQESKLFQIWIYPNQKGLTPRYGQKSFEKDLQEKKIVLVASNDGKDGSIEISQDASIYISKLKSGDELTHPAQSDRKLWVQVIDGLLNVNNVELSAGDAVAVEKESLLKIKAASDAEFMLFDLNAF